MEKDETESKGGVFEVLPILSNGKPFHIRMINSLTANLHVYRCSSVALNRTAINYIMFLARVKGSVVATKKDSSMSGRKLLLLRPQLVDDKDPTKFRHGANTIVAVDS